MSLKNRINSNSSSRRRKETIVKIGDKGTKVKL